jgi:NAD(P)-dependent dehydrogenase (short-subunit alcohol dehydrogenase family)
MRVQGKAIVVTGGGGGIGRQLVLDLVRRGSFVTAADIRQEGLDETRALAGAGADNVATVIADVTDRAAVEQLAASAVDAFGTVDGYISNAGIIQPFVRLTELDYESIDRVIAVNLYGAIHMAKTFVPLLLERPVAHLANVSSMGAFLPVPGQTIYGAAKAGVKLLTEGLYAELLETDVGVSVVMPGAVATDITSNSGVDIPVDTDDIDESRFPTTAPDDAARIIIDGIEKDRLHILVGRDARMMNVANRVAPKRSTHLIQKQMKELLS